MFSKSDIHIFINQYHAPFADVFFKYITYLGEGWLFALAIPAALFISPRAGIHIALAGLFTLIFTGLLKQVVFEGYPRPIEYFRNTYDLYQIAGVKMNSWNSFPSGHTTAAFAMYCTFSYYIKRKWAQFLFFTIALLVGYSRMYLSQHFLVDVVFGAALGVLASFAAYYISSLFKSTKFDVPILGKHKKEK